MKIKQKFIKFLKITQYATTQAMYENATTRRTDVTLVAL
jgi:hypothetical protein